MFQRDLNGEAVLGGHRLSALVARDGVTTPFYAYDLASIADEAAALGRAFGDAPHLVAYAVKANSAGSIIRTLAARGCGADVVSAGELMLALACGVSASKIVFSGVGKRDDEMSVALGAGGGGIRAIQIESIEEIPRLAKVAERLGALARVSLRLNPGVEADTHAHIATGHDEAKFGIPRDALGDALSVVAEHPNIDLIGLSSHIGSQLTDTAEYLHAARLLVQCAQSTDVALSERGCPPLAFLDCGGGFGIDYGDGCASKPADFARGLVALFREAGRSQTQIVVEPGRSLVAAHGLIVSRVLMKKAAYVEGKARRWLIVDAGMNDLIRPALYAALHRIEPLALGIGEAARYRVVGPVCESSDDFGEHAFSSDPGDFVVIRDAGAYGFTMASEYNGRALATEVFLEGDRVSVSASRDVNAWVEARTRA